MGLKKTLFSGIVASIVARSVVGKGAGIRVVLLTGLAVALQSVLSGSDDEAVEVPADEVAVE